MTVPVERLAVGRLVPWRAAALDCELVRGRVMRRGGVAVWVRRVLVGVVASEWELVVGRVVRRGAVAVLVWWCPAVVWRAVVVGWRAVVWRA
ncbi:hypothetical protein, partial [Catenulispora pinisilvae]|uniref:hypothetical protein n=1 Tax=Catenulispora pinisilvae TaxID=2705253 RepID=UPI001E413B5E